MDTPQDENIKNFLRKERVANRLRKMATFCFVLGVLAVIGPVGLAGVRQIAPIENYSYFARGAQPWMLTGVQDCILAGFALIGLAILLAAFEHAIRPTRVEE